MKLKIYTLLQHQIARLVCPSNHKIIPIAANETQDNPPSKPAIKKKSEEKGKPDLNILFIYNMPFRAIAKMTNGAVSMEMVRGIVTAVNGHFFRGMKQLIGGYLRNRWENRQYETKLNRDAK